MPSNVGCAAEFRLEEEEEPDLADNGVHYHVYVCMYVYIYSIS